MFKRLRNWLDSYRYYVTLDASDNSVTLSRGLFKHILINFSFEEAKVLVFKWYEDDVIHYGFIINPKLERETQLCQIQYNDVYKCIGFESLCPTVNQILYDYGFSSWMRKCQLSVKPKRLDSIGIYYSIEKTKIKS